MSRYLKALLEVSKYLDHNLMTQASSVTDTKDRKNVKEQQGYPEKVPGGGERVNELENLRTSRDIAMSSGKALHTKGYMCPGAGW